jgi:kinetochore protein Spc25
MINLRLPAYEASTWNFLKAVANYGNCVIAEITKRKEWQALERKKVMEKTAAVESETNQDAWTEEGGVCCLRGVASS